MRACNIYAYILTPPPTSCLSGLRARILKNLLIAGQGELTGAPPRRPCKSGLFGIKRVSRSSGRRVLRYCARRPSPRALWPVRPHIIFYHNTVQKLTCDDTPYSGPATGFRRNPADRTPTSWPRYVYTRSSAKLPVPQKRDLTRHGSKC